MCTLQAQPYQVHTWQNIQARDVVADYGITLNDIVCRPCRDDIRRIIANPSHSPRWEKIKHDVIKCCVKGCPDICFAHSTVTHSDTIKQILEYILLWASPIACVEFF